MRAAAKTAANAFATAAAMAVATAMAMAAVHWWSGGGSYGVGNNDGLG